MTPKKALHTDRGRILVSRDTAPLQRPRRVNFFVKRPDEGLMRMHKMMVGVRIDDQNEPDYFGWDEVNDLIRHGMKVTAVVPGEFYQGDLDHSGIHSMIWYSTVVLDDYGIDRAELDDAIGRRGSATTQERKPTDEIPW